eukprot:437503_1
MYGIGSNQLDVQYGKILNHLGKYQAIAYKKYGKIFWYNKISKKTQWNPPNTIISATNISKNRNNKQQKNLMLSRPNKRKQLNQHSNKKRHLMNTKNQQQNKFNQNVNKKGNFIIWSQHRDHKTGKIFWYNKKSKKSKKSQ